jgi:phage terminase Nu1 subunit (DNA packaging protein)
VKKDNLDDKANMSSLARIVGVSREAVANTYGRYMPDGGTLRDWLLIYCQRQRDVAAGRGGQEQYELTAERARLAHHQANKTRLEEEELRGSLVRIEYVSNLWATIGNNIKNKLRGIPHKTAHLLEAAEGHQEILEILQNQIDDALIDLSDGQLLTETNGISQKEAEPSTEADS